MKEAYIELGGNMEATPSALDKALEAIAAWQGVSVDAVSSLYLTEPQGRKDQPWFSNRAARLLCEKDWTAQALLAEMLKLESSLGRTRDPLDHFGPRVIDLDLLLFNNETLSLNTKPLLELPHPRLCERAFVLVPLREIAPELILPDGRAVSALLEKLPYRLEANRIYQ